MIFINMQITISIAINNIFYSYHRIIVFDDVGVLGYVAIYYLLFLIRT